MGGLIQLGIMSKFPTKSSFTTTLSVNKLSHKPSHSDSKANVYV